jgi:Spy/CpxP family protein refolding chaperone
MESSMLRIILLVGIGCNATESTATTTPNDTHDARGQEPAGKRRAERERLCARLGCTDEQAAAVAALYEDAGTRPRGSRRDARREADIELANAFRTDAFSTAHVDAYAQRGGGDEERDDYLREMEALHGILTPAQRELLAEEIETRGPPGGGPRRSGDANRPVVTARGDALCELLRCNDAQAKRIEAFMSQAQADQRAGASSKAEDHRQAIAAALRSASFDAAALQVGIDARAAGRDAKMKAVADALVAIHGVLSVPQRAMLAGKIEQDGLRAVFAAGQREHAGPNPTGEGRGKRGRPRPAAGSHLSG